MDGTLDISGERIGYELVRDRSIRNSYIKFRDDKLVVLSPNSTDINKVIEKHGSWILKHYRMIKQSARIMDKDAIFVSGARRAAVFRQVGYGFGVELTQDCVIVSARDRDHANALIERWLRERSYEQMYRKTLERAEQLSASPKKVLLRRSKKWGLCTSAGVISYNPYVAGVPEELVDYIAVHEVSHLKVMSHSAEFWRVVGSAYPDYKTARKRLHYYDNRYRPVF
ncbi:MAG: DUF45 domain-containing protein [Candidatus Micrarchaeota archaeon]|nr:DUF45 domain-containing protein [Candidatus Micrarchaeota archaeon]